MSFSSPTARRRSGAPSARRRRYSSTIKARAQARFGSVATDEERLMAAARYAAMNPLRARLVERAEDWRSSSVAADLAGRDDVS
jgi:putative transposase